MALHHRRRPLLSQGRTISYIARTLPLDRKTVRRFARAADVQDLLPTTRTGRSLLDEYAPYLRERVAGGCVDAAVLTREITAFGYRGSAKTVRRFLQPLRTAHTAPPSKP
ncbi:ISL3 family transposase, partial [Rhodococcus sp. T2V]|nr:ISL3 family transposase [Rhodococcus sp. T2V]